MITCPPTPDFLKFQQPGGAHRSWRVRSWQNDALRRLRMPVAHPCFELSERFVLDISFLDLFLHLDTLLTLSATQYGAGIYALLFTIIFLETGMLPFPFLPGDSLLFVAGALAATASSAIKVDVLMVILICAAILGNLFNYATGKWLGNRLFANPESRLFKRQYLEKTELFYQAHGRKTTLIARFVPIVRTFAPFVAGMASMPFRGFLLFTVVGAIVWVVSLVYAGYLFGNVPLVRDNLSKIIIIGIVGSLAIASLGALRKKLQKRHP